MVFPIAGQVLFRLFTAILAKSRTRQILRPAFTTFLRCRKFIHRLAAAGTKPRIDSEMLAAFHTILEQHLLMAAHGAEMRVFRNRMSTFLAGQA